MVQKKRFLNIVTIIITCTFLYQNTVWASGWPSNLASDTKLDEEKFLALSGSLGEVLGLMQEVIESDVETLSTGTLLKDLNESLIELFNRKRGMQDEHYRNNLRLAYYPPSKRFYLYSISPRGGKGVIYRLCHESTLYINEDLIISKEDKPFKTDRIGDFILEVFDVTDDISKKLFTNTNEHEDLIITDFSDDDTPPESSGPTGSGQELPTSLSLLYIPVILVSFFAALISFALHRISYAQEQEDSPAIVDRDQETPAGTGSAPLPEWIHALDEVLRLEAQRIRGTGRTPMLDGGIVYNSDTHGVELGVGYGNNQWDGRILAGVGSRDNLGLILTGQLLMSPNTAVNLTTGLVPNDYSPNRFYLLIPGVTLSSRGGVIRYASLYGRLGGFYQELGGEYEGGYSTGLLIAGGTRAVFRLDSSGRLLAFDFGGTGPITIGLTGENVNTSLTQEQIDRSYIELLGDRSLLHGTLAFSEPFSWGGLDIAIIGRSGGIESMLNPELPNNSFGSVGARLGSRIQLSGANSLSLAGGYNRSYLGQEPTGRGAFTGQVGLTINLVSLTGELLVIGDKLPVFAIGLRYGMPGSVTIIPKRLIRSHDQTPAGDALVRSVQQQPREEQEDPYKSALNRYKISLTRTVVESDFDEVLKISGILKRKLGPGYENSPFVGIYYGALFQHKEFNLANLNRIVTTLSKRPDKVGHAFEMWNRAGFSPLKVLAILLDRIPSFSEEDEANSEKTVNSVIIALGKVLGNIRTYYEGKWNRETLMELDSILRQNLTRLKIAASDRFHRAYRYLTAVKIFNFLTRVGRYPGDSYLIELAEFYLSTSGLQSTLIDDPSILRGLKGRALAGILSADSLEKLRGLILLDFLAANNLLAGFSDIAKTNVIEILISYIGDVAGSEGLPEGVTEESQYFINIKTALFAIDAILRIGPAIYVKPEDSGYLITAEFIQNIRDVLLRHKALPKPLQDRSSIGMLFHPEQFLDAGLDYKKYGFPHSVIFLHILNGLFPDEVKSLISSRPDRYLPKVFDALEKMAVTHDETYLQELLPLVPLLKTYPDSYKTVIRLAAILDSINDKGSRAAKDVVITLADYLEEISRSAGDKSLQDLWGTNYDELVFPNVSIAMEGYKYIASSAKTGSDLRQALQTIKRLLPPPGDKGLATPPRRKSKAPRNRRYKTGGHYTQRRGKERKGTDRDRKTKGRFAGLSLLALGAVGEACVIDYGPYKKPGDGDAGIVDTTPVDTGVEDAEAGEEETGEAGTDTGQPNQPPTADPGPNQAVDEGSRVILDGSLSSDPEGRELRYRWEQTTGPEVIINDADRAEAWFIAPSVDRNIVLRFKLTVTDPEGIEDTAFVEVTVRDVPIGNHPPVAVAEVSEPVVDEGAEVTLDGRNSSDLDRDLLTYGWIQVENGSPRVIINNPDQAVATFTAPEVDADTEFVFELRVSDGRLEAADRVTVTVRHINKPPVAVAGVDQIVDEGSQVTLDGGRSSDPDRRDSLTYEWIQVENGSPRVIINNPDQAVATFTALEIEEDTEFIFELRVSDGRLEAAARVSVTVRHINKPPVAVAGIDQVVDEGAEVTLDAGRSSDPDRRDILSYRWVQITGPRVVIRNSNQPIATFVAPEVDEDTELIFELEVSDGRMRATDRVSVSVRHVNKPPVANVGIDQVADEGIEVTLNGGESSDPDEMDVLTYEWTQIAGPIVVIQDSNQLVATFTTPDVPDGEEAVLRFRLTVRDGQGGISTDDVEVRVMSDTIVQNIIANIEEGNEPVTLLGDSSRFNIDGTRRLSTGPQFVINNNAGYIYDATNWGWELIQVDRQRLLEQGITYDTNGRNHAIILSGLDQNGRARHIKFLPIVEGGIDNTIPYRIVIQPDQIRQLAQQRGIDLDTINIRFVNLAPGEGEFILNGFQRQYTVIAIPGEVLPDRISPVWNIFHTDEAGINAIPTPQGINISFNMRAGDNQQSAGINVLTRFGGIDLVDADLQGAWQMDEGGLGTDSGPNGNILTNVNGVESVPGRYGNAARLTAANESYLTIPPGEQTGLHITGDMTVSAWIKIDGYPRQGFVIAAKQEGNFGEFVDYSFYIENGLMKSWNGASNLGPETIVPTGEWHHVAFVRQGNNIIFYLDGIHIGTFEHIFPQPAENAPFYIGHNGLMAYGDGLLDELAIFNRALTPEEIQGIHNQVDSSNFLTPALATTELKVRGNSPFILRLTDNLGEVLDVFILGLDPANWRSIIINILQAQAVMNPSFNLGNVASVQILVNDTFLPAPEGEVFNGTIEIQGLVGIPPTTRHRYATDSHDIDITREDYEYLIQSIEKAEVKLLSPEDGISIIWVRKWQDESGKDILLQNGLGFTVNGRIYSAFTGPNRIIYIPHPDLIKDSLNIEDNYVRDRMLASIEIRNSIIIGHEIDEIHNPDHREAVFDEFSEHSINGLNYADVVTVLLETLSSTNITTIDDNFHRQFIANLLIQGMFLDKGANTYLRIIREMVDDRIDEDALRQIYTRIIGEITGLVTSHRFTHKRLSREETAILDNELLKEPGFTELSTAIKEIKQGGTIYIDLAKFFVRNNSLATENEVVTIDFEYLKRFAALLWKLQGTNVQVKGIYSQRGQKAELIEQLTSIIREDLGLGDELFPIQAVDFTKYLEFVKDSRNIVSILTESSWQAIPDRSQLKIVDSTIDRYNHINSSGWEFYTALRGLNYDTPQGFLTFIIDEVLQQLTEQRVITHDEALNIKEQILRYGIAFIPTYYDPIQYYRTIESQKALLIAA